MVGNLAAAVALASLAMVPAMLSPRVNDSAASVGSVSGLVRAPRSDVSSRTVAPYPSRAIGRTARQTPAGTTVVYLKTAPTVPFVPTIGTAITQRDETFSPRLVAVTQGSSVSFPNGDGFFHNVFSLSRFAQFNLGRYPRGESRSWRFAQAGVVKVFCEIHAQMTATVLIFDHPFFTVADGDGRFRLNGVPAGDYQLAAWHDRSGEQTRRVTVVAGQSTTTDFVWPGSAP